MSDAIATPEPAAEPAQPTPEPAQPAAPAAPEPKDWREGLPEDLRGATSLKTHKSLESLVKDYVSLQPLIGADKVPLPPKDATPEDMDRFYNALGRPEKPDQYDLGEWQPPEGVPWDEQLQKNLMEDLHSAGLTQAQMKAAVEAYGNRVQEQWEANTQQIAQANAAAEKELRQEWGQAYDSRVDLAKRAFKATFGELAGEIADIPLPGGGVFGDHPVIAKAFAKLGEMVGEDKFHTGDTGTRAAFTPAQAQAEINRLENDKGFMEAYLNTSNAEHGAAVKRMMDLQKAITEAEGQQEV